MADVNWSTERTAAWNLAELAERRSELGAPYLEFLRVPDLSVGIYVLDSGAVDGQSPHAEDEVYFVVEGRARLRMGDHDVDMGRGDIAFVAAGVEHRFHDIEERLLLLVAFGPAEGSRLESTNRAAGQAG